MTQDTGNALKALQDLNARIREARKQIAEVEERLEEVEAPALELDDELSQAQERLQSMKLDQRRLELAADEKRARSNKMQERLNSVRNLREEAAVRAELDMMKHAMETEEQESLALLDQITRVELLIDELQENIDEARAEIAPRRKELLDTREAALTTIDSLETRRDEQKQDLDEEERRLFESFQAGGRETVVAELTSDGACSHCFSMVPLQRQNEIRHGTGTIQCEACGVILTSTDAGDSE